MSGTVRVDIALWTTKIDDQNRLRNFKQKQHPQDKCKTRKAVVKLIISR